jgi:hypothetical protein
LEADLDGIERVADGDAGDAAGGACDKVDERTRV